MTAHALLAARLEALGHQPDFIDRDAADALVAHAGGSAFRLRAALASTLFLASTEDAPRIDRSLVERALREETEPVSFAPPAAVARMPSRSSLGVRLVLPSLVTALLGLDYLAWRPTPHQPTNTPALVLPRLPATSSAIQAATPVPKTPPPVRTAAASASPSPSASPMATTSAPASPTPLAEIPDALPIAPPATVLVRFPRGDPAAEKRAAAVAQSLRRAGIDQVDTRPSVIKITSRPIAYFYVDDLNFARKVTQILSREPEAGFGDEVLVPKLAIGVAGTPVQQPGLVEVHLQ